MTPINVKKKQQQMFICINCNVKKKCADREKKKTLHQEEWQSNALRYEAYVNQFIRKNEWLSCDVLYAFFNIGRTWNCARIFHPRIFQWKISPWVISNMHNLANALLIHWIVCAFLFFIVAVVVVCFFLFYSLLRMIQRDKNVCASIRCCGNI